MRPALLRMAIRYLEDSDEAEDAVQDVLLKLWFLRDRLDQYRSVDALAIVITKHLCINRLRGIRIEIAVWSAGIAAMMVIALGLGFIFYSENQADGSGEWSCYEGSYVEVGGKRISDVKQIMPCIIETLEKAERVEKLAQERVEEIHRSEKEIEEKELLVSE